MIWLDPIAHQYSRPETAPLSADAIAPFDAMDDENLKKHKNVVFRMFQIVPEGERVEVTGEVADAVDRFLEEIVKEGKNALKNMNKNLKNYIYKKILNN